jgi:hypothetical protein
MLGSDGVILQPGRDGRIRIVQEPEECIHSERFWHRWGPCGESKHGAFPPRLFLFFLGDVGKRVRPKDFPFSPPGRERVAEREIRGISIYEFGK